MRKGNSAEIAKRDARKGMRERGMRWNCETRVCEMWEGMCAFLVVLS